MDKLIELDLWKFMKLFNKILQYNVMSVTSVIPIQVRNVQCKHDISLYLSYLYSTFSLKIAYIQL